MIAQVPTQNQIQRWVAKNQAFGESENIYRRNYVEEPVNLARVRVPKSFKPTDKAVAGFILKTLRRYPAHHFSAKTIGKKLNICADTVQKSLRRMQRAGYLRLNKLKTGFVRYTWFPNADGAGLTVYDACESLLSAFPELLKVEQLEPPEASEIAMKDGRSIDEFKKLWLEFREACNEGQMLRDAYKWERWLRLHPQQEMVKPEEIVLESHFEALSSS